jgi:hypothetical protein
MTVKELKKILRHVPDDAQVEYAGEWTKDGEPVWWEVTVVEPVFDLQFDKAECWLRIYGEAYPDFTFSDLNRQDSE